MAMMNNLYKRGISGKILFWRANVEATENYYHKIEYRLVYEYGELGEDGSDKSLTRTYSDYIVGKANRSDSEQAQKELNSIYDRQKKKGYKSYTEILNVPYQVCYCEACYLALDRALPKYNTDANNCIKPMKCQKFEIGKMNYPCIIQPKINGVRCTIMYEEQECKPLQNDLFNVNTISNTVVIKSKEGLIYKVKHIEDMFADFYKKFPQYRDIVFDGEFYIKDKPVTTIGGAARSLTVDNKEIHDALQFICFDLSIPDLSNAKRDELRFDLGYIFWQLNSDKCNRQLNPSQHNDFSIYHVVFLCSNIVHDDSAALKYMEDCIEVGYEGAVIRDSDAVYCFGQRPKTMRKLKKFEDAEFKILDIRSVGNPDDKVGFTIIYTLQNDINDKIFECNGTGTVEEKVAIINNKQNIIGKLATVKFYERTKFGLPFHANVINIRDYES